jgi:hypothetical protein
VLLVAPQTVHADGLPVLGIDISGYVLRRAAHGDLEIGPPASPPLLAVDTTAFTACSAPLPTVSATNDLGTSVRLPIGAGIVRVAAALPAVVLLRRLVSA